MVSGSSSEDLPSGCLVAPDDLHRKSGITTWAVDATLHFRLNPENATEVFNHYEHAQVAVFSHIENEHQVHQFTIRPTDWDRWLDEAGIWTQAETQSAGDASAVADVP
jgi:hypothetical protein